MKRIWPLIVSLCVGASANAQDTAVAPETDTTTPAPAQEAPAAQQTPAAPAKGKGRKAADRLDLDTTTVTGNRELPKVLYIVPWKKADLGELPGQPFNTLLDDALAPVDRDVFRREVTYFDAVAAGHGAGSAAPGADAATGKAQ